MNQVTLVVPCYNEAGRLHPEAWLGALDAYPWLSLIFVDDGSTDATSARLASVAKAAQDRIRHLALTHNSGKGEAVRHGLIAAIASQSTWVGYWDADLATPLDEVARMLDIAVHKPNIEWILGSRVKMLGSHITRNPWRHWAGRMGATLASEILDLPVYDTQCGAKLLRNTRALKCLLRAPFLTRWAFDVEMLLRWRRLHPNVQDHDLSRYMLELPLQSWSEIAGSKLKIRDALRMPLELIKVRYQLRDAGPTISQMRRQYRNTQMPTVSSP